MNQQNLQLTFSGAPLGADKLAALDAYRARTALGETEIAALEAAVDAYLSQHPGMIRADAAAAVTRVLFEARRALPTKPASFDRLAFAAKRDAAPGGLARRPAAAR